MPCKYSFLNLYKYLLYMLCVFIYIKNDLVTKVQRKNSLLIQRRNLFSFNKKSLS